MTRWSLVISEETDQAVRLFLAQTGAKKGALSAFVERAVRDRLERSERFFETAARLKERNARFDQQEILDAIDEAVADARAHRP